MTAFEIIRDQAERRLGGAEALAARMPVPKSGSALCKVTDSSYLSMMSRRIFRAGLKHSMVDAKWPAFEEVFSGFDIDYVRMMSDEDLDGLMKDRRIIRHWGKIKSVRANATAIHELLAEYDGVGAYIAAWPTARIVALWDDLKRRFTQMGGHSGPYFLRMAGKDTFILSKDVVRALNHWGAFEGEPATGKARLRVQEAFSQWAQQSGKALCQISMTLALSVD
ncbi:MAG: DNA-3-methyladenine glycosylase I [Gammaproteobacteria bacterium]